MAGLDVPPSDIAALAGQPGWDAAFATVADSVRGCVRRLDTADLQDLDAGRRREAILAGLREAAVAEAAHRLVDVRPDAPVLTLWQGLAALRPPPPGVATGWASPVDRSGPRWARVREDLVDAIDRIAEQGLKVRFPLEGLLLDVDRDPVAAGDDVTSHRERWTLDSGATVDGVLLGLVRGYPRARVHGGASWLVELRCAGRTTPLAVVIDHDRSGGPATEVLSLLPRVAGRPLVEVAAPHLGQQIEIYLRYLVNSRLRTPDQLAAERTVAGAEPRLIVKDD
ncbi:MAG TPA: hypothetical protein VI110_05920 [Lapillicoccus sp.]